MKWITVEMAEKVVVFAQENSALIEQKEFKEFDRHVILTIDGLISLKTPKGFLPFSWGDKPCSIEDFHGFDNKLDEVNNKFKPIKINGYPESK